MKSNIEESKESTSSEEAEYDSDVNSAKSIRSMGGAPKLKIVQYLSTELVTGRNLTLADIQVESYPESKIKSMESELLNSLKKVRIRPLLIDPKAEMKA